jgi:DNA-binding response OmpR family regulator
LKAPVKVLIAEDDAFFRRALQQLLSTEFETSVVEDGDAAWALLQKEDHPTLVLLDWIMPGLSGPQVCRELRANSSTAGIYVILLTAKSSAADIIAGLRAGADDYVTKPFEAEELRARVRLGRRILELQDALAEKSATPVATHVREWPR